MSRPLPSQDDPRQRLWMLERTTHAYHYACGSLLPAVGIVFALASLFLGWRVLRRESLHLNPARNRRRLAMRLSGGLLLIQLWLLLAMIMKSVQH